MAQSLRALYLPRPWSVLGSREAAMVTIEVMPARLTREETDDLRRAVACLEGASFAQRLTDVIGRPVELLSRAMPQSARRAVGHATEAALRGALKLALRTLDLKAAAKP